MADSTLAALTAASTLDGTELLYTVQGGADRKATGAQIGTLLTGSTSLTGATVTTSNPVLNLSQTWNAGGVTFTGLKLNATDTASASGSLLLDLQVGGVSKASIQKTGALAASSIVSASAIAITGAGNLTVANGGLRMNGNTGPGLSWLSSDGLDMRSAGSVNWSATDMTGTIDLRLWRDAANTLALRNGANAQSQRTYFSYTDASNYTRFAINTATGVHTLAAESAGTGEANVDIALTPKGTGAVRFGTASAIAAETVTGYITIKDAGGTARKLAVVS